MNILNKKGQDINLNWIVGALAGILLSSVIITIGLQWYATTQKTEESFDALIAKIESLKEGEKMFMPYYLQEDSVLVSFSGGEDFNSQRSVPEELFTEESCDEGIIQVPDICGAEDCLCVCDAYYKSSFENACQEDPIACYPFTSEATKELSFYDSDCSIGVYREGPNSGVFTLYLQREGNTLQFCSSEDCGIVEEPLEEETETKDENVFS